MENIYILQADPNLTPDIAFHITGEASDSRLRAVASIALLLRGAVINKHLTKKEAADMSGALLLESCIPAEHGQEFINTINAASKHAEALYTYAKERRGQKGVTRLLIEAKKASAFVEALEGSSPDMDIHIVDQNGCEASIDEDGVQTNTIEIGDTLKGPAGDKYGAPLDDDPQDNAKACMYEVMRPSGSGELREVPYVRPLRTHVAIGYTDGTTFTPRVVERQNTYSDTF
jgi:hypothetical protein